jgi:PAS domain S-box-containing protein
MSWLRTFLRKKALGTRVSHAINETIKATTETKELIQQLSEELDNTRSKYQSLYKLNKSIIDAMPGPVWCKNKKGRYIFINRPLARLLDIDVTEAKGKRLIDFVGDHDWSRVMIANDKTVLTREKTLDFIEQVYLNGEKKLYRVSKAPLYNVDGELIGTVGFGRDITEVCDKALSVVEEVKDVIDTCPRVCEYSGYVNSVLNNIVVNMEDVIATACDTRKRDNDDGE